MTDEKIRENRIRRAAERQGLRLEKSRRRDPRAADFGQYWLMQGPDGVLVAGGQFGTSLDVIEEALERQHCVKCGRAAPDQESDEFLDWEAADNGGQTVVCPDCITPTEETAMAEDFGRSGGGTA